MNNRRNYYRILQVQPDAPFEIIRASYRTLMRELKQHPDLGGELWRAKVLNEAYETLSNSVKRLEYDKNLFETYVKQPFPVKGTQKKSAITIYCPFCKRPLGRDAKPGECCRTCRSPLHPCSGDHSDERDYKRSVERLKKYGKLKYYSSWPQKGKEAKMVDISPSGIRFICTEKLRHESTVKLSSPLLKAIAKVINSQRKEIYDETYYTVGVEFMSVTFAKTKGSFISTFV